MLGSVEAGLFFKESRRIVAQPVWVLSVDLQTKTATFQSGMAEAAKSARGAFTDIKSGASEMGGHVSTNMFASRHAIMAVSEAFGDTMPRAITALLVHIGPLGAALEAAFPFAAIGLAAVLLIEHFEKLKEAGIKLTEDQLRFSTAAQTAFNALDQKLIQAGIRADELRNDHLGALGKQLELIDKQSMDELVHSFGIVAKAADVVFGDLQSHWYKQGIGAAGAKHALEDFQAKYEDLLVHGKDKEASDLLRGTRESAEKVLALQNQLKTTPGHTQVGTNDVSAYMEHAKAEQALRASGVGITENEVKAQQTLVAALNEQVQIEQRVAELKKLEGGNATKTVGNELAAKAAEAAKQAAEHQLKMGEAGLAAEREQAAVMATLRNSTIAERLAADTNLADKEYRLQLQTNGALVQALDKGGKDYNNQLKSLQDKAVELTAQHQSAVAILQGKAQMEQYHLDLANLEQAEREKIDATDQGSSERLAAINAAIKAEEALNLQATAHFRELLTQRTQTAREAAAEDAKQAAEAGRLMADDEQRMGELSLAAQREHQALIDSGRRVSVQMRQKEETAAANAEYALKLTALSHQIAALDKGGKDYENKLRALQAKQRQLVQEHENEITAIKDKATMERNSRILAADQNFNNTIAAGLTQSLMGHQSFAATMDSIGSQIVSGMMENAIKSVLANDFTKESDAAAAARKAYLAGMHFPFPANIIMGPLLGAAAFASVMAFQDGTDSVPGIGRGDRVPALLEPGEGVVPGGVMDGLRSMARSGSMGGGNHYHLHARVHLEASALDGDGMDKVLTKHGDKLQKHFETALRKLNR